MIFRPQIKKKELTGIKMKEANVFGLLAATVGREKTQKKATP